MYYVPVTILSLSTYGHLDGVWLNSDSFDQVRLHLDGSRWALLDHKASVQIFFSPSQCPMTLLSFPNYTSQIALYYFSIESIIM